jgi:hypothetical protein
MEVIVVLLEKYNCTTIFGVYKNMDSAKSAVRLFLNSDNNRELYSIYDFEYVEEVIYD